MIMISLDKLDDSLVNELFISAIKLMQYFCLEGSKDENDGNEFLDKVSMSLNNNNRETALFNCLKVNSDDVKKSVVACLFCIEIEQFEIDEIRQIVDVQKSCHDISAGETEIVLSTIYWIITKMV